MGVAKLLKLCIRQPRPQGAIKFDTTYGMPSTHSCAIAFFGVYLALCAIYLPLHPKMVSLIRKYLDRSVTEEKVRKLLTGTVTVGATLVCWSRVRSGHHTSAQVAAGISLGSLVAVVWLVGWIGLEETSRLTGLRSVVAPTSPIKNTVAHFELRRLIALGARDQGLRIEKDISGTLNAALTSWRTGGLAGVKATLLEGLPRSVTRSTSEAN